MLMSQQTVANARTRPDAQVTDVPVNPMGTVTCLFRTGTWGRSSSETGIKIPYQVAFDGEVQERGRTWPTRIIGGNAIRRDRADDWKVVEMNDGCD